MEQDDIDQRNYIALYKLCQAHSMLKKFDCPGIWQPCHIGVRRDLAHTCMRHCAYVRAPSSAARATSCRKKNRQLRHSHGEQIASQSTLPQSVQFSIGSFFLRRHSAAGRKAFRLTGLGGGQSIGPTAAAHGPRCPNWGSCQSRVEELGARHVFVVFFF